MVQPQDSDTALGIARFTFIDLFAGLGGFHQAAVKLGGKCVFASELREELRTVYAKNFNVEPQGDIRDIEVCDIPSHDVLFAGFPCQPFSKAGKQLGWRDAVRGTLFENILEIASSKRPTLILLENVAHFVKHDSGNTYKKVRQALEALDYSVFVEEFSPHQFGIPHIRQRFYLVAISGKRVDCLWPTPQSSAVIDISSVLDRSPAEAVKLTERINECMSAWQEFLDLIPASAKLPSFPIWATEFDATYPYGSKNLSRYSKSQLVRYKGSFGEDLTGPTKSDQTKCLPSYARGSGIVFPDWKQAFIRQNRQFFATHRSLLVNWVPKLRKFPFSWQKFEWNCQGENRKLSEHILQFRASGLRVKRRTTAPSLVAMTSTQVPIITWEKRYMTLRECARLQSMGELRHLPDGEAGMAALGNAVNVTVVERILQTVLPQVGIET